MGGRVTAAILVAATFFAVTASAGLPKRAGISYAVTGRWEKALDIIPADTADGAERYFRAISLLETGRVNEGLELLSRLGATQGAFGVAALEKIAEYAFEMGRYEYLVKTVGMPVGVRFVDPDAFNYRLGMSLYLVGRSMEAKGLLEKVDSHRFKPYALHTLSLINYAEGDIQAAVEILGKALDLTQYLPNPGVKAALADKLRLVRGRMIYQATVTARNVNDEQKAKLFKLAISQLTAVKPDSPYWGEVQRTIGWCSLEMNDTVRALASFQIAMGADPENSHEDVWATGRVFERLGFFEDAAAAYGQAAELAREKVKGIKAKAGEPFEPADGMNPTSWGKVLERLGNVEWMLSGVRADLAAATDAAALKRERLAGAEVALSSLIGRIDGTTQELQVMTRDLYRYLDAMNPSSLFPKKDRARVAALMDRRASLDNEIAKVRSTIMALEQTRSYTKALEARRRAVKVLWENLDKASFELAQGEMAFLEGVKRRVSVREKELVALLNEKKAENEGLRPKHLAGTKILGEQRKELGALEAKLELLKERVARVGGQLAAIRTGINQAVAASHAEELLSRAEALSQRADQFSLDEVQALDRQKAAKLKEGAK